MRVCLLFKTGDRFVCCWKLSSREKKSSEMGGWRLSGGRSRVLQRKVRERVLQSAGDIGLREERGLFLHSDRRQVRARADRCRRAGLDAEW